MENQLFLGIPKFGHIAALYIMWLNIGTPKNHHFLFGTNGTVVELGAPILKHFRVILRDHWTLLSRLEYRVLGNQC